MGDALNFGRDVFIERVLRVQRRQDAVGALQRVDAGVRHGGVGHLAVHGELHLQAAVVRGDHLVAKAGGNHQVGVNDFIFQQPGRADFAAEFFVIGEHQFDAALLGLGHGFERAHRKGEGRKIAFAHCSGAAVNLAGFNLAAVGVLGPAFAGGHHVAVRVQRNGAATWAVGAARHQVGDAFQACCLHGGLRHFMFFNRQAHGFYQPGSAQCMRRVVAGRCVGGHADEFLQELHLFVKVGVDPGVELGVVGAHVFSVRRGQGGSANA